MLAVMGLRAAEKVAVLLNFVECSTGVKRTFASGLINSNTRIQADPYGFGTVEMR